MNFRFWKHLLYGVTGAVECFCILLVFDHAGNVSAGPKAVVASEGMFLVGEELEYEVSYAFLDLGTIRIHVLDTTTRGGKTVYTAKAFIDSYDAVPFVNLHYVFYSEINEGLFSHYFSGSDTRNPAETGYADYLFNYNKKQVVVETGIRQRKGGSTRTTDTLSTTFQDGLSLLYYARGNVHSKRQDDVPTFINEKKVTTLINFTNKRSVTTIDAVKYPIETVEFDGRADFIGIFGMTGEFRGWFSNDQASVPVVATMKVILGNVHIELIRWNRPGWVPPKAMTN